MQAELLSLNRGKIAPLSRGENSAIAKTAISGRVHIGWLGIEGDQQADPRYHGGRDKALHHYPFEHYAHWSGLTPNHPLLGTSGAFGENISTLGLTEDLVCIGDRFRCGMALLEISQGRQPCWKQADRMQWATLPKMMVQERRSGWYYRVIEEGETEVGDMLSLVERPLPDWNVKRVFALLIGGEGKNDPAALQELMQLEQLEQGWRNIAANLLNS
jgi:MOSC domain-containing protein YiiM